MKISLYSICLSGGYYGGPPVPLLDIIAAARGWGYDGIELEGKRPHGNPMDLDGDARRTLRQAAADEGLEISCVAAYNDYSSPIEEHRQNELLMTREQIRLAHDIGAPVVRVFAQWSGVTLKDGAITYDIARYNIDHRYPGQTALDRWCTVRDTLAEAAQIARDWGVTLALQNHEPIIHTYRDMLAFIEEIGSPALKACLDAPLMKRHTDAYYRQAICETGSLLVHTHYGGRFERRPDGVVTKWNPSPLADGGCDDALFMQCLAEEIGYAGHTGYELCSPVLIGHRHAGLDYALEQMKLAAEYMREIVARTALVAAE